MSALGLGRVKTHLSGCLVAVRPSEAAQAASAAIRVPPLRACRALGLKRAVRTCRCPVASQHLPVFLVRIAIWQPLAGRATIDVFLGKIDEVLFAEAPL